MGIAFHPFTRLVHGDDYVSFEELSERFPGVDEHGNVSLYGTRLGLLARYGLTGRLDLFGELPLEGKILRVAEEDAHHRDETMMGVGDLRLGARYFLLATRQWQLGVSGGLRFPTGRRHRLSPLSWVDHEEAEALGVEVPDHSHLQLGTGTLDPFGGFSSLYRSDSFWLWFIGGEASAPFYAASDGYRTAPQGWLLMGPAFRIPGGWGIVGGFVQAFFSGRDRFLGADVVAPGGTVPGTFDVPNTGRFELILRPSFTWLASSTVSLDLQVTVPVYTAIAEDEEERDVQLTEPAGLLLSLSWALDLAASDPLP